MYDTILNEVQKRGFLRLRGSMIDRAASVNLDALAEVKVVERETVDRAGTVDLKITAKGKQTKLDSNGRFVRPVQLADMIDEAASGPAQPTFVPWHCEDPKGATVFVGTERVGWIAITPSGNFATSWRVDRYDPVPLTGTLNEAMAGAWAVIKTAEETAPTVERMHPPQVPFEGVPLNFLRAGLGDCVMFVTYTKGLCELRADSMTAEMLKSVDSLVERGLVDSDRDDLGNVRTRPTEHGRRMFEEVQTNMFRGLLMDAKHVRGWDVFEQTGLGSIAEIDRAMRRLRKRGTGVGKTTFVHKPGEAIYYLDPRPDVPKGARIAGATT